MAFIGLSKADGIRPTRRAVVGGSLGSLGAFGFAGLGAAAQSNQGTPGASQALASSSGPTVRATGSGTVKVSPDSASIVVGVDIAKPTLAEAQSEATATMEAVVAAIKQHDVPDEDIQTATFSVYPIRDYDPETGVPGDVSSFQVTNQVGIDLHDIDDVGPLLDDVVAAGANNIYGITFYLEDPSEANREARRLAFEDAKTRAEELADNAGLSLGGVLAIQEGSTGATPYYSTADGRGQAAGGPPISPGVTSITVNVDVVFGLA